jgi:hypothetical protein
MKVIKLTDEEYAQLDRLFRECDVYDMAVDNGEVLESAFQKLRNPEEEA